MTRSTTLGDLWLRAAVMARRMAGVRRREWTTELAGCHVAVLAADGVDLAQLDAMKVALRGAGAKVTVIARDRRRLRGRDGRGVAVQRLLRSHPAVFFDALYLPGGEESVCALCVDEETLHFVRQAHHHGMPIAASGGGTRVLRAAGLHVGDPKQDAQLGVITDPWPRGRGGLGLRFVAIIAQDRQGRRALDAAPVASAGASRPR